MAIDDFITNLLKSKDKFTKIYTIIILKYAGGEHAKKPKMLNGFIKINPEATDDHFYNISPTPILWVKSKYSITGNQFYMLCDIHEKWKKL